MFKFYYPCDFSYLLLQSDNKKLLSVDFTAFREDDKPCELLLKACEELDLYFAGRLRKFQLPLARCGTAFERKVYQALSEIPYGQVMSYAQVAHKIGSLNAARAVGNANAKNPLPIFVPCHRVISANGLGGYSGGVGLFESLQGANLTQNENSKGKFTSPLDIKRYLLKLEGVDLSGIEK